MLDVLGWVWGFCASAGGRRVNMGGMVGNFRCGLRLKEKTKGE